MAKLSIISPARNEKYLPQTVESCLSNARGEVEFIAVVEDYKEWPAEQWAKLQAKYPNLHTIYNSSPKGMRPNINAAAASAISRGAKYLMKLDAHCAVPEGFDTVLQADCDKDWIVVPRRLRLDPDTFAPREDGRRPIDYHYLSFPDNVKDFGGPGLNGKVWDERQRERETIEIDDEMSSQGSGWFMHADYFQRCGFMDTAKYGPFWNEFQELGMTCWLTGGSVKVNKRTWYAHWHKGSAGRGYHLPKEWLNAGATFTKRWLFNDAGVQQTRPFSWLIQHFWPVPTWPANWEELVYGTKGSSFIALSTATAVTNDRGSTAGHVAGQNLPTLKIHRAYYGIPGNSPTTFAEEPLDVTEVLQRKVVNGSLDLNVTNAELEVGNPFRGFKKRLWVQYAYDGGVPVEVVKDERDWLIIGQSARYVKLDPVAATVGLSQPAAVAEAPTQGDVGVPSSATVGSPLSPLALNDFLIRKFNIPSHRLRGPMPIEVPSFHRNDLAKLFAELGFNRGAEIGVAEGKYSEVLVKANPKLQLLCVDPWHRYKGNPQSKTAEKDAFAYNEAKRRLAGSNAILIQELSMEYVRNVVDESLDFVYIDGHHGFDYVMQDLIEWSKRVRSGGLITGDDFYYLDPKRWGAGPVEAVLAYTTAHKINPWFIFEGHKSVDFMFVKGDWK